MKTKYRKKINHIVFDDENEFHNYYGSEAPELADDWRTAPEGSWVVADDGGIVQILKRGELPHPHDRKNYKSNTGWVRTIVGTFKCSPKTQMDTDFDLHPQPYTFSKKSQAEQRYNWKIKEDLSKNERIFLANLQSGKPLQQSYEDAFGAKVNWRENAIALLKLERIRKELNKNLEQIADKLGLDYEYILKNLMLLVEDSQNENVKLGSLRELKDWIKEQDEPIKKIQGAEVKFFEPFDQEEILSIEAERVENDG